MIHRIIEAALNAYLNQDPEVAEGLVRVRGKRARIVLTGVGVDFCIVILGRRLEVHPVCEEAPDVELRGTPGAFARLGVEDGPGRPVLDGDVVVDGDTQVGNTLRSVLKSVEIDWEELLARRVGDITAHAMAQGVRGIGAWLKRSTTAASLDLSEYLQEEARILPSRQEVEDFIDAVDVLRSDADRLEVRILRLRAPGTRREEPSPSSDDSC